MDQPTLGYYEQLEFYYPKKGRLLSSATIVLLLLISLFLRFYPALASGLPFSIDAWPLIRNVEELLEHTPVSLDNEKMFDGYNNYWPASIIFGAVLSLVTGLSPMVAMTFGLPAASALAAPLFFLLACKIFKGQASALFTSILLAVAFPYALFTAGVTKETYANPIYALLILIFLSLKGWRGIALFAVSSMTLVMAHHLTSLATLAILASISLSMSLKRLIKGVDIDWTRPLPTLTLAISLTIYFTAYAHRGLKITVSLSDLITVTSYQLVVFVLALYVARTRERESSTWVSLKCLVATIMPTLILALCTARRIMPEAPILPRRYMIYGIPFIISAPLAVLGFEGMRRPNNSNETDFEPLFWLTSILALEAYAVFGNSPAGLALAYRVINFIWPPLAMLCGYGAHILYSASKRSISRPLVAVVITLMVALNCYNIYAAILIGERYMGYFWLYRIQEYRAGAWISDLCDNKTVSGDVKYAYLLRHYFGLNYDEFRGLLYLSGTISSKPSILITYDLMKRNGYVVYGGYSIDLPGEWLKRTYNLSLVYSNGLVNVHASN